MRSPIITGLGKIIYHYIRSVLPICPKHPPAVVPVSTKKNILTQVEYEGLARDAQWAFVPNMKFTLDMFDTETRQTLMSRMGVKHDKTTPVPQVKAAHLSRSRLAQKDQGISKEPVLMEQTPKGYKLLDGWHRTVHHFDMYPNGFTGPAYLAEAQKQPGTAAKKPIKVSR